MMNIRCLLAGVFLFLGLASFLDAFSPSRMSNQRLDRQSRGTRRHENSVVVMGANKRETDWILAGAAAMIISLQVVTLPSPAIAAGDVDIAHGSKLFQANCAGCHAGGMNFVSEKKTLKKEALEKYRKTTDETAIQDFVQKGMPHRFMPFANEFSDSDYKDIVSFVLDQALNDKW